MSCQVRIPLKSRTPTAAVTCAPAFHPETIHVNARLAGLQNNDKLCANTQLVVSPDARTELDFRNRAEKRVRG